MFFSIWMLLTRLGHWLNSRSRVSIPSRDKRFFLFSKVSRLTLASLGSGGRVSFVVKRPEGEANGSLPKPRSRMSGVIPPLLRMCSWRAQGWSRYKFILYSMYAFFFVQFFEIRPCNVPWTHGTEFFSAVHEIALSAFNQFTNLL